MEKGTRGIMVVMSSSKKKTQAESTIHDVVEKLVDMDTYMRGGFKSLNERMDVMDDRLSIVERKVGKIEVTVLDIQDDLKTAFGAIDKNSVDIVDHERRIRRLEKAATA